MHENIGQRSVRLRELAVAAGLLAASGCSCTLIGCQNGLAVILKTEPTVAYRIEATSGFSGKYVCECADPKTCIRPFFADYLPASVTIKVITAAGSTSTTLNPSYEKSEPNGPHCGPTCTLATVEVPFPGS